MSRWTHRRRREPPIDPRLQSERTAMSWQRTALGVGAIGLLLLHNGVPATAFLGGAAILMAVALLFLAERRYEHTLTRVSAGEPPSSPALMRTMTGTVMVLAAGAIVFVVLPAP